MILSPTTDKVYLRTSNNHEIEFLNIERNLRNIVIIKKNEYG
jgi:hypothetical protein